MAGHRRQNGSPICPEPLSPPSSRESSPTRTITPEPDWQRGRRGHYYGFVPSETPSLVHALENLPGEVEALPGGWRLRRNPNWEGYPRPPSPPNSLFDGESIAPTEPASHCYRGAGDRDDFIGYSFAPEIVMGTSKAIAAVYSAPPNDMDRIRNVAAKHGFFHGIIHRPKGSGFAHDNSEWVVLGRDARAVSYVLNGQEQGFGGGMGMETMYAPNPKASAFLQLAAAGTLGGIVVAFGLSIL